jgi:hypothetical protein
MHKVAIYPLPAHYLLKALPLLWLCQSAFGFDPDFDIEPDLDPNFGADAWLALDCAGFEPAAARDPLILNASLLAASALATSALVGGVVTSIGYG